MELQETKLFENLDHFNIDCVEVATNVRLLAWASQQMSTYSDGGPNKIASAQLAIVCMEIIDGWMKQLDEAATRFDRQLSEEFTATEQPSSRRHAHR